MNMAMQPSSYGLSIFGLLSKQHAAHTSLHHTYLFVPQALVEGCDANNDGFIDFEEFKNLIKEAESAYVRNLFKTYDLNLDGYITQVFFL